MYCETLKTNRSRPRPRLFLTRLFINFMQGLYRHELYRNAEHGFRSGKE